MQRVRKPGPGDPLDIAGFVYHDRQQLSTKVDGVMMVLDRALLREARRARDRLIGLQHEAELAQVSYQHTIRRLHGAGGSLREIADALGLSYQRVHQIVDVAAGKGAVKECRTKAVCSFCGAGTGTARRLIAGPGVLVCEQCVVLAQDLLGEGGERVSERTRLVDLDPADHKAQCSFCGKKRQRVADMIEARISRRSASLPGPQMPRGSAATVSRSATKSCPKRLRPTGGRSDPGS